MPAGDCNAAPNVMEGTVEVEFHRGGADAGNTPELLHVPPPLFTRVSESTEELGFWKSSLLNQAPEHRASLLREWALNLCVQVSSTAGLSVVLLFSLMVWIGGQAIHFCVHRSNSLPEPSAFWKRNWVVLTTQINSPVKTLATPRTTLALLQLQQSEPHCVLLQDCRTLSKSSDPSTLTAPCEAVFCLQRTC